MEDDGGFAHFASINWYLIGTWRKSYKNATSFMRTPLPQARL